MKQPTAPSLYPEIPTSEDEQNSTGQNYRLNKISEIEKTLLNERETRKSLYKKYKRGINITDGVDTTLISSSVILAGVGLAVPIMLPLGIVAVVCGGIGGCVKFIRRKLHTKALKHYEIKTLVDSKLNTIKDLISKALTDGEISENEFKLILNELDKFNNMKDNMRKKQKGLSNVERDKLIAEGRDQVLSEFKKLKKKINV